jgi:hypothetical protein
MAEAYGGGITGKRGQLQFTLDAKVFVNCCAILLPHLSPRLIQLEARKSRAVNEGLNDTGVQTTC